LDPESHEIVPLFHPRHHAWAEHFIWSVDGIRIVGLTPIVNTTIAALELNRERALAIRAADLAVDRHPPAGDARERVESLPPLECRMPQPYNVINDLSRWPSHV
jgi:hypothetical protein